MTPTRWERVKQVLEAVWERDPATRAVFLDDVCSGDPDLRRRVEALLASDERTCGFLGTPVVDESVLVRIAEATADGARDGSGLIGTRVGRYRITSLIGRGGMGAVYRAVREDDFRMEVAVKLLKRGTDTQAALSRFRSERQILARLQHPNIARLLDGGATDDGLPYLVMEYVNGKPLLEYSTALTIGRRLELFRSVCAAVQYAHQNLVIHRDIKPSNILVDSDGIPRLLDFGIAKLLDAGSDTATTSFTRGGGRLMTPEYASPEQASGEPITTATDIYSLGAVLYELLTGKRAQPIDTLSPGAIESEICTREPVKPSSLSREIDTDLDNITLMAMRKEPHRRYSSAEQLSEDIRLYLEGRPVRARKDTVSYRLAKLLRRNRVGVAVAALALTGTLTGVVAVQQQARRAEHRFQQVRKLANTVLFDLNREIETLAGSTKAREVLVRTSLEYLDSLAAEAGNDESLQFELAEAYEKVGDVQGLPVVSHLGQSKQSLDSYAKALAIAEKLPPSEAVLELTARSWYKTGCVYNWGLGRVVEARDSMRRAIRIADSIPDKTGRPSWRVRAEAWGFLGDLETYRDPAAASEPLKRSLELAKSWAEAQPDAGSRYFLAVALSRTGTASQQSGDLHAALERFMAALRLIEQLLATEPANAIWIRERDAMYDRLGWVTGHPQYFNLGLRKQAQGWAEKLVGDAEVLAAADPANVRAAFELSEATAALAAVSRESAPSRAEELYRRSLALSKSVLTSRPDDSEACYWNAFNRVGYSWVLRVQGKRADAVAQLTTAIDSLRNLAARDPDDSRFREYLGVALHTRAEHRIDLRGYTDAERDLAAAIAVLEPLYRQHPRNLSALQALAECYRIYGVLNARRADSKSARECFARALTLWQRWAETGVSTVYDQQRRDLVTRLLARSGG